MNIATDQTIEVMRTQAAALEKSEQLARVHRIVMDYFRLTAYAEETIRVLEESKKKLMALCASIQTDEDELLRPYDVAVNEVCNASEMNQDNFFFIADQLGRKIAWEIDKKRIVLKEDADISAYLDGSCEILQAEGMLLNQPAEHVQPAQEQADEAPETPTNQPTIAGKQENADAVNPSETTPSKEDEVTSEETNDTDTPPKLQDDEPKVENGQKRAATPGNSETIAEKQSSSEEKNVDASAANKEEQPKAETEEKVPGTWEGFSSYLDEKITVGVANDKESEKAAENQFLKKNKKRAYAAADYANCNCCDAPDSDCQRNLPANIRSADSESSSIFAAEWLCSRLCVSGEWCRKQIFYLIFKDYRLLEERQRSKGNSEDTESMPRF